MELGRQALEAIERHTRVPCGFASVRDVRLIHAGPDLSRANHANLEDRFDSFVLAETFKYALPAAAFLTTCCHSLLATHFSSSTVPVY